MGNEFIGMVLSLQSPILVFVFLNDNLSKMCFTLPWILERESQALPGYLGVVTVDMITLGGNLCPWSLFEELEVLPIFQYMKYPQPLVLVQFLFLHSIAFISTPVFQLPSVVATWTSLLISVSNLFYNQKIKLIDLWAK